MSGITLKDHFRETQMFNVRSVVMVVFAVILTIVLISRLIYLQVVDHELYATLSEDNRFKISAVAPTRGLIYDRNGILLAQNLPTYSLVVTPERVKNLDETIESLSQLIEISEGDISQFKREVRRNRPFKTLPLRTRLNDEEIAKIAVNRHLYSGVDIAATLIRHYPQGGLGVHALGYVGRINEKEQQLVDKTDYEGTDYIGKTGIEKYYETELHGHVGVAQEEINASGRRLRVIPQVAAEPGKDLHLTLDAKLQRVAEKALGNHRGAIVAIDPANGNILTLASTPIYDPNLFVTGIDKTTYTELRNDDDLPLFNRALRGRYPPGSTVKPFISLAALEGNVIAKNHETNCKGWFSLPGDTHRYRDWKKTGHGSVNVEKSIVQSCDVFYYELAVKIGVDRLASFMFPFGFNSLTDTDISGELAGLWPTTEWKRQSRNLPWYLGETVSVGIGQGSTLVTPLQLASSTATLSMYGQAMRPRIVAAMVTAGERVDQPIQTGPAVEVKNVDNWKQVIKAMEKVVHDWRGTAFRISKGAHYKIAGKTGTAQVFSVKQDEEYDETKISARNRDHALFIAFAPVESPRIAVAVIVENGGHGGSTAAPIARKIMDYYLNTENVAETTPPKKS
ncbi:MAG: penicillin-binding protein 2 [Gammaproteobacteria bacterium]|nr:penicillin-binding protein 2 [Gammaproteobacteria bacterium]MDH5801972.1 penicillin-binding protein 2 [Gammaproteobacteria bacterium]